MEYKITGLPNLINPDKMITKKDFDEKMAQQTLLESKTYRANVCNRLQALIQKILSIKLPINDEES